MLKQKCLGFQEKTGDGSVVQNFKLIGKKTTSADPIMFQTVIKT